MIIAIDTGGTKTLVAAFRTDGTMFNSIKFPTPKDRHEYITRLTSTVHEIMGDKPIDGIVVAVPGVVRDGIAIWCSHLGWSNFNIQYAISEQFPGIPLAIENDGNLGGLGETRRLSPIPISSLYVTISTGIGTGFIANGSIDPGLRLSEGGHMLVEFQGKVCEWESFAAGSAIHDHYGMYGSEITDPIMWQEIADRISRGFLAIIPLVQPDTIIIGGSMGTHFPKYENALLETLKKHLPDHIPVPRFINAEHPEEAVIYGCYYYAIDSFPALSA